MAKNKEKLMIIDGNALIHRSFHALPPTMTTKNGEPTNAVYGFALVFLKALQEFKPDYAVLTLDVKGPTFRHQAYKEYKATRKKAPDELYSQIPKIKELARAFGLPIYEKSGFEADDLIGTIAAAVDGGIEKIIVTGDLDALQLVDEDTKVYTMSRGLADSVLYDEAAVAARFGLKPAQMIDYKALRGDPSDNIPGVRGIGEKTAIELLKEYGTLDKVYSNLEAAPALAKIASGKQRKFSESVKPRVVDLLKKHKKEAYLSRDLAAIRRDVKMDFELAGAKFGEFDRKAVIKILSELEFKSLLSRVQSLAASRNKTAKEDKAQLAADKFRRNREQFKYVLVDNDKEFGRFLKKLKTAKAFAFDTETSSFDPLTADLLGISFSWQKGEAYYLEFLPAGQSPKPRPAFSGRQKDLFSGLENAAGKIRPAWLAALKPILENNKIKKYGHNIKFDLRVMRAQGAEVKGIAFDTMVASYLLNPGTRQHNLDALAFSELGHEKISKDELLGQGREKKTFGEVESEKLALYSGEDADFTNRLVGKLGPELKKKKLARLFQEIEMPLVPVLAEIEDNGIMLDKNILFDLSKKISKKIKIIEKEIYRQAGREFNINSTRQLRDILFTELDIPIEKVSRTKTGLSTAANELVKLKDLHPIVGAIQEYRELNKLATTYTGALSSQVNGRTGRLHTSFNQAVTATGRLSSTEPNLQNIPVRTEFGREIRRAFIAAPGHSLLSLDYSQIELRLAAHMSGDPKMIKAFKEGTDIHTATAAEISGIRPEEVTKEMRREAKAVNFGILYGQGPHGLSETADIPYARAKEFIDQYFAVYGRIKKFIDETVAAARGSGFVETLFGRRRYLPEINSSVVQVRKAAERMAVNTPLQGTAADMIKLAMIRSAQAIKDNFKPDEARLILQVHDELLFEVKAGAIKRAAEIFTAVMTNVIELRVPVIVDAKIGDNWGEMEEARSKL